MSSRVFRQAMPYSGSGYARAMRALVTGAAGFIGTHLVGHLLNDGWDVLGIDARDPGPTFPHPRLRRARVDLVAADPRSLGRLCEGIDVVFHLAGQPGVRSSWSDGFARCVRDNVDATQRLLEAVRRHPVGRLVFASSSSVYGDTGGARISEDDPAVPHSPYGVTKLAAEMLCRAYAANFGVPAVSVRYFTVYGPGQRPDMSIHRMIRAALTGEPFHLYGDGSHSREFTFVTDAVRATVLAATAPLPGGVVINVSGGVAQSISDTIRLVESAVGRPLPVVRDRSEPGDVQGISANLERARELLGWRPRVPFALGLRRQVDAERVRSDRIVPAPDARLVS